MSGATGHGFLSPVYADRYGAFPRDGGSANQYFVIGYLNASHVKVPHYLVGLEGEGFVARYMLATE